MVGRVARRLDAYCPTRGGWCRPTPRPPTCWWPTSRSSSAWTRASRSTRAVSASWPATTSSRHRTWACPWSGVGLLYRSGYFRQALGPDGGQRERYPATDWADLPLRDQLDANGETIVVEVEIGDETVRAAVRTIQVGRVALLLLDADIEGNPESARHITDVLYGGDREHRIRQEILLGVGGVRALAAAGLTPTVFHMNEGHSALLAVERMRALIVDGGLDLGEAREQVVASTVFTTHTPVPAGNEIFDPELARQYLEPKAAELGMTWDDLAALAAYPEEGNTDFGMTPLALRTSGFANGVAALHGDTSRHMWRGLWPALPVDQVPITSITNGIHPPSWLSREMHELLDRYIGPGLRERPRGPGRLGQGRHDPGRRALARSRAAPRAPGAVRARAPAPPDDPPGLAPHRQPRGRGRAAPRRAHDLLRPPLRRRTSGPTCSSATRTAWRACSATSADRCR